MNNNSLKKLKQDIVFKTRLRGHDFVFYSTWGLFNPKSVDEGSQLLIDTVDVAPDARVLDIGCGYGPLGLALAKLAPSGTTHMVDKDFVAVDYAQKNAYANKTKNVTVYLSNGLSAVPVGTAFDLIVSNLPAKVGNELLSIIMHDAKTHLKPGGRLCVVTISGLKTYIKRNFIGIFGNYKKLKQGKTYTVAQAVNE